MGPATIFLVMGFILSLGTTLLSANRARSDAHHTLYSAYETRVARDCARSGAQMAIREVLVNSSWREGFDQKALGGGHFDVTVEDAGTNGELGINDILITAQGTYADQVQEVRASLVRRAYSHYAYFTDYEPQIWFITGDTIRGPVHTNGQFHIYDRPVFTGHVTSVADDYATYRGIHDPDFQDGAEFGVAAIDLPTDLEHLESTAQNGGRMFYEDTWLTFESDGTVEYQTRSGTSGTIDLDHINGAIYVSGDHDLFVQGTLNGQVTMGSEGKIRIQGDLVYNEDPRIVPESDDYAGLVALDDIVVQDTPANRNNCHIHASMMAIDGSFQVHRYNRGAPRGTLHILGGVIQKRRGPVGTFGGSGSTGYIKNYAYDERLLSTAPPAFPIMERPVLVAWAD